MTLLQKLHESRHLIPVVALIGALLGSIYSGVATASEAAAVGAGGGADLAVPGHRHGRAADDGVGLA